MPDDDDDDDSDTEESVKTHQCCSICTMIASKARVTPRAGCAKLDALDKLLLSRDQALEQAQSTAEANERCMPSWRQRSPNWQQSVYNSQARRMDGWAKSKAKADTLRGQTATGLANTDEGRVVHRLMECIQAMEAEVASRQ
jgi:hypothetical protein